MLKNLIYSIRAKRHEKGLTQKEETIISDIACIGPAKVISKEYVDWKKRQLTSAERAYFGQCFFVARGFYGIDSISYESLPDTVLVPPEHKITFRYCKGRSFFGRSFTVENEKLYDMLHEGDKVTLLCRMVYEVTKDYKVPDFSKKEIIATKEMGTTLDSIIRNDKVIYKNKLR